ncbi:MAG: sigma-70 family RNA polymerase sigma factor [Ignavibacteriaceae bacterium]|nr:sigma-70 family RNA polymerase sigma factor [Ignavibacteriaceae bacterium]
MNLPVLFRESESIKTTIKSYGNKLFGFIRNRVATNEDAEDILQDVWFQLSKLDSGLPEQIGAWLYKVAQNKIIDKYRKQEPDSLEGFEFEDEEGEMNFREILLIDDSANPEAGYLKKLFWEELFVALSELPEAQSEVFIKNEIEDKKLQDIADEKGENIKTIISRKRYAVIYLRDRLRTLYEEILNKY